MNKEEKLQKIMQLCQELLNESGDAPELEEAEEMDEAASAPNDKEARKAALMTSFKKRSEQLV